MLNEWPQDNKFCTRVKGRYRLCNMIVDWDINQQMGLKRGDWQTTSLQLPVMRHPNPYHVVWTYDRSVLVKKDAFAWKI